LPSQRQLKWSQLKVGSLVVVASLTLGTLIVLMSGGELFTNKIMVKSYFPDAGGLAAPQDTGQRDCAAPRRERPSGHQLRSTERRKSMNP